jgi:hypothetical protein
MYLDKMKQLIYSTDGMREKNENRLMSSSSKIDKIVEELDRFDVVRDHTRKWDDVGGTRFDPKIGCDEFLRHFDRGMFIDIFMTREEIAIVVDNHGYVLSNPVLEEERKKSLVLSDRNLRCTERMLEEHYSMLEELFSCDIVRVNLSDPEFLTEDVLDKVRSLLC